MPTPPVEQNAPQSTLSDVVGTMQGLIQVLNRLVPQTVATGLPPVQPAPVPVVQQITDDGGIKLDEFLRHQPPTFSGTDAKDDPRTFIDQTQRLCHVLHCPSWRSVELASFRLQGVASSWFDNVMAGRDVQQPRMEWEEFKMLFLDRFLPVSVRDSRAREFESLKHEGMSITDYANRFTVLSVYAPHLVPTEDMRVKRFISGLRDSIFHSMASAEFPSFSKVVDKALAIEDRQLQARATRDQRKRSHEDVAAESGRDRRGQFRGGRPYFSQRGGHQPQVSYRNDGMASQSSKQTNPCSLGGNQRRDSSSFIRGSSSSSQTKVPCKTCGRVHGGVCYREIGFCFRCGQHGHYMSQCPTRGASLQHMTARPTSSYASVIEPIGQPHVSGGQYVVYVPAVHPQSDGVGQTPSQIEGGRSQRQDEGAQA
ncbi:unnamed protein product [Rhodiola kirilowii]